MLTFNDTLGVLILRLFEAGVVKIDTQKGFKLKLHETKPDAPLSPIFLNIRTPKNPKPGPLDNELVDLIGVLLWQHTHENHIVYDAIAGLPNAGVPLAEAFRKAALKDGRNIPLMRLGKIEVGEGMRKVEGIMDDAKVPRGKTVLLIDDLITEAHTTEEGVNTMRVNGYNVVDVLVVVDRQQGGKEYLKKRMVGLWRLLTLPRVIRFLAKEGKISKEEQMICLQYLGAEA